MIPAGSIISLRQQIEFAEMEIPILLRRRDAEKQGSRSWCYHQQRVLSHLARYRFLRTKLEILLQQPIPAGVWGYEDE
jgi:hypothetical protein